MMRGDDVRKAQGTVECHLAAPGKIDGVLVRIQRLRQSVSKAPVLRKGMILAQAQTV